jgi:uncharacterized protein YoxC
MTALLVVLTLLEIAVVIAALVVYLVLIRRSLARTVQLLAKVSFGVRAIETQCEVVGPATSRLNQRLAEAAGAVHELNRLAEQAGSTAARR